MLETRPRSSHGGRRADRHATRFHVEPPVRKLCSKSLLRVAAIVAGTRVVALHERHLDEQCCARTENSIQLPQGEVGAPNVLEHRLEDGCVTGVVDERKLLGRTHEIDSGQRFDINVDDIGAVAPRSARPTSMNAEPPSFRDLGDIDSMRFPSSSRPPGPTANTRLTCLIEEQRAGEEALAGTP